MCLRSVGESRGFSVNFTLLAQKFGGVCCRKKFSSLAECTADANITTLILILSLYSLVKVISVLSL